MWSQPQAHFLQTIELNRIESNHKAPSPPHLVHHDLPKLEFVAVPVAAAVAARVRAACLRRSPRVPRLGLAHALLVCAWQARVWG